jgi:hypothetical protein
MGWGAILSFVGSQAGSQEQQEAAAEAKGASALSQAQSTAIQEAMFNRAMGFTEPYRLAGEQALQAYESAPIYGFTPEEEYRLQQDQAALQRIYSAQGKRKSGQAARGAAGLVEQASADAYNRAYRRQLEGSQLGSQAAQMAAGAAMGAGQGISSAYMQGAQNQIPYIIGQGQERASNIAALSNLGGSLANYYQSRPSGGDGQLPSYYNQAGQELYGPGY